MQLVRTDYNPADDDIILVEDLVDNDGNFYNLTLKQALEEQCEKKPLLECRYKIKYCHTTERWLLDTFLGWTEEKVIFNAVGIGVVDTLLDSVPRNPGIR